MSDEGTLTPINDKYFGWTSQIEKALDLVRLNCISLSKYHNLRYQTYKNRLRYFRIPIILISSVSAFAANGFNKYMSNELVFTIITILSLSVGIISSVELYLNLQKKMESEMESHKEYNKLNIEIFRVLSLQRDQRKINGTTYYDQIFNEYQKIMQSSNTIESTDHVDLLSPVHLLYKNKSIIATKSSPRIISSFLDTFSRPFTRKLGSNKNIVHCSSNFKLNHENENDIEENNNENDIFFQNLEEPSPSLNS